MDQFDRTELKLLLKGLQLLREEMREDVNIDLASDEYNKLLKLKDRITDALESRFY